MERRFVRRIGRRGIWDGNVLNCANSVHRFFVRDESHVKCHFTQHVCSFFTRHPRDADSVIDNEVMLASKKNCEIARKTQPIVGTTQTIWLCYYVARRSTPFSWFLETRIDSPRVRSHLTFSLLVPFFQTPRISIGKRPVEGVASSAIETLCRQTREPIQRILSANLLFAGACPLLCKSASRLRQKVDNGGIVA